jgi:hypothetical protein
MNCAALKDNFEIYANRDCLFSRKILRRNGKECPPPIYIQGEHKGTLHFQNNTENKHGALRTEHLHQSIEKLSKFCTHLTQTRYVLRESHDRCRDDNPTRPKLCAVSLVMEAVAVVIRCLNSGKDRGRGRTNTFYFL